MLRLAHLRCSVLRVHTTAPPTPSHTQQGKLLAAVNNKVMLFKMEATAAGRQEIVSDCSPVGVQVLCLHLAVR